MTNEMKIQCNPIGVVRADEKQGQYYLLIEPEYREGLLQLNQFSHVMIIWWADKVDNESDRKVLTTTLPYAKSEQAGVFACRSEYRPNPIAITTMMILDIDPDKGIITIPWIDAQDGTPILDLKPYLPCSDRIRDVQVAAWMSTWPEWMEDAGSFFAEHAVDFGD